MWVALVGYAPHRRLPRCQIAALETEADVLSQLLRPRGAPLHELTGVDYLRRNTEHQTWSSTWGWNIIGISSCQNETTMTQPKVSLNALNLAVAAITLHRPWREGKRGREPSCPRPIMCSAQERAGVLPKRFGHNAFTCHAQSTAPVMGGRPPRARMVAWDRLRRPVRGITR